MRFLRRGGEKERGEVRDDCGGCARRRGRVPSPADHRADRALRRTSSFFSSLLADGILSGLFSSSADEEEERGGRRESGGVG